MPIRRTDAGADTQVTRQPRTGTRRHWTRKSLPGDFLLRPVAVLSGLLLVLNDHVLKAQIGNAVTGKLSDGAGLVFVPLLLLALLELGRSSRGAKWSISYSDAVVACALVGAALIGAKLSVSVAHGFGVVGGVLRYPFRGRLDPVFIAHDPGDLLVLPALAITVLEARRVIRCRARTARLAGDPSAVASLPPM